MLTVSRFERLGLISPAYDVQTQAMSGTSTRLRKAVHLERQEQHAGC